VEDVTESAERQLWSPLVDSSDSAILFQDNEGTIATWNSGAEKIYGYAAHERHHCGGLISSRRRLFANAADKVDGDAFRADTEDEALGFCISSNQPILLFPNPNSDWT